MIRHCGDAFIMLEESTNFYLKGVLLCCFCGKSVSFDTNNLVLLEFYYSYYIVGAVSIMRTRKEANHERKSSLCMVDYVVVLFT